MNKLPLIIKREYLAKVRNKSFVIMTFLSPILMVGMVVLIAYLTKINDNEKRVIGILNDSDYFSKEFVFTESTSYIDFQDISLQEAKDSTANMGFYGLLHIPYEAYFRKSLRTLFFIHKDAPNTLVLEKIEDVFQERLRQQRLQEIGVTASDFAVLTIVSKSTRLLLPVKRMSKELMKLKLLSVEPLVI